MSSRSVARGRIVPPSSVLRPPSTIGFIAGRGAACGSGCSRRSCARSRRRSRHRQHDSQSAAFGGGRKRGADAQAIGRSRRGRTTKIHAIVDSCGRPIALEVTPGQLGDSRVATVLISAVPPGRSLAGDAASDSDGLRRFLLERGTTLSFPTIRRAKKPHPFNEGAYRQRNLIERMFCRLKDWRRIATPATINSQQTSRITSIAASRRRRFRKTAQIQSRRRLGRTRPETRFQDGRLLFDAVTG